MVDGGNFSVIRAPDSTYGPNFAAAGQQYAVMEDADESNNGAWYILPDLSYDPGQTYRVTMYFARASVLTSAIVSLEFRDDMNQDLESITPVRP
jgi:hypothetical protein